jgi:hypothetical protein
MFAAIGTQVENATEPEPLRVEAALDEGEFYRYLRASRPADAPSASRMPLYSNNEPLRK